MPKPLMIGDLARLTGTKVNTIRFYEDTGLLPPATRTAAGRRTYDEGDLRRLAFIRHARALGFGTPMIQSLLDLADEPDRDCEEAKVIAKRYLLEVVRRIRQLQALKAELSRTVTECGAGRRMADCRIMEVLSQPLQDGPAEKAG